MFRKSLQVTTKSNSMSFFGLFYSLLFVTSNCFVTRPSTMSVYRRVRGAYSVRVGENQNRSMMSKFLSPFVGPMGRISAQSEVQMKTVP